MVTLLIYELFIYSQYVFGELAKYQRWIEAARHILLGLL